MARNVTLVKKAIGKTVDACIAKYGMETAAEALALLLTDWGFPQIHEPTPVVGVELIPPSIKAMVLDAMIYDDNTWRGIVSKWDSPNRRFTILMRDLGENKRKEILSENKKNNEIENLLKETKGDLNVWMSIAYLPDSILNQIIALVSVLELKSELGHPG